jgi:hypothetical protein
MSADGSMKSSTTFWSNGKPGAAQTFGHEILHSIYPEKVGLRGGWNQTLGSKPNLHDDSFDDASDDIR